MLPMLISLLDECRKDEWRDFLANSLVKILDRLEAETA
jgi:hypothetical protein